MSDLGTMVQLLSEDSRGLVSATSIKHKIIASIRFHRDQRWWKSEREFRLTLTAGRAAYAPGDGWGLPADLQEIVGRNLDVGPIAQPSQRYPVTRVSSDELRELRSYDTGRDRPRRWDFHGNTLRLWPTPDSAADELTGRYVRDIGVPIAIWRAGAWKFYEPNHERELTDTYTSDWLDQRGGADMIRYYAAYLLYGERLKDPERASEAQERWAQATAQLRDETEGKTGGAEIEGFLLDECL